MHSKSILFLCQIDLDFSAFFIQCLIFQHADNAEKSKQTNNIDLQYKYFSLDYQSLNKIFTKNIYKNIYKKIK